MNRFFGMCAVIMAAGLHVSPVFAKPAPRAHGLTVFEFKGIKAGVVQDKSRLEACPAADTTGTVVCQGPSPDTIAGRPAAVQFYYYSGKLSSMVAVLRPEDFADVIPALEDKYGQPCASNLKSLKSRAGETYNNPIYTWCFATGKLVASQLGQDGRVSSLEYVDDNQAPPAQYPRDF